MKKNIKQITDIEVIELIEDGLLDFCTAITQNTQKELKVEENLSWIRVDPSVWPNFILKSNLDNDSGKIISKVVKRMRAGEIPKEWLIKPKTLSSSATESLTQHGFSRNYSLTGMAIDLDTVNNELNIPDDVEIKVISDESSIDKWAQVVSSGLFHDGTIEANMFYHLLGDKRATFYMATKKDKAIASSMLLYTSKTATINLVATLPEYRNLGIGTAMTTLPLLEAKNKGYLIGLLQASQMGKPIYKKIGFKEYCTFDVMKLE